MDVTHVPGLIDRRAVAADEYRTRDSRAIYRVDVRYAPRQRGPDGELLPRVVLPVPTRRNYDVRMWRRPAVPTRDPSTITRVILHQTGALGTEGTAAPVRDDQHRLDVVIAHFIVRFNGNILYTHDIQYQLNSTAALNDSIEIEFEGTFNQGRRPHPRGPRLSMAAIEAGRRLLTRFRDLSTRPPGPYSPETQFLSIGTIHPHQQFSPVTRPNCPGPDIWVNVGEWAHGQFGWTYDVPRRYRRPGISEHTSNQAYRQPGAGAAAVPS